MNNESRLLTLQEIAQMLGVSPHTVYGWTSRHVIPFRKVGHLLRFDRIEVDAWSRRGTLKQAPAA